MVNVSIICYLNVKYVCAVLNSEGSQEHSHCVISAGNALASHFQDKLLWQCIGVLSLITGLALHI